MAESRVDAVMRNLLRALEEARPAAVGLANGATIGTSDLRVDQALALFEDQVRSRQLDVMARTLKDRGQGFYTISSAGHEQNAVLGALLRTTDPCLLHYRSGAFMLARARQEPGSTPLLDALLGLVASSQDPIAQGRHKVWGSRKLFVLPQTSTIGSHLPKAVGMAFAHTRAQRLGLATELPDDAIVCCSFGDASLNHASALTGLNAARWGHRRGNPVPVLFVCEDNGIGLSVDTPRRWVEDTVGALPHLAYFRARGELDEAQSRFTAALVIFSRNARIWVA